MLPREMKLDERFAAERRRKNVEVSQDQKPKSISQFLTTCFRHFNARELNDAADAYIKHIAQDGKMFLSMAGAMSTGELGRTLAPMIRADKIHGISCTGANLEEDLFNLVAHSHYEQLPKYRQMKPKEDQALAERNINRVTDTGIPEQAAMTPIEQAVRRRWKAAAKAKRPIFPHEILYDIVRSGELAHTYEADPENSWLLAAAEKNLPIVVPGWEDSTLGNVFAADVAQDEVPSWAVRGGIDYMVELSKWYRRESRTHPMGFFQIGGGIAGDFSICVVPMLAQDMGEKATPKWAYFCQINDGHDSCGSYSPAMPTEKISWGKLLPGNPAFSIFGDASICAPLIFAKVLNW